MTYANVASTLALVLAVSTGGAYAQGLIGSADIKRDAVKSRHIDNGAVKSGDIKRRTVKSRHIDNGTVQTRDIKRNSVGTGKIKASAVTRSKLAPDARTRITMYTLGSYDFSTGAEVTLDLPASVSAAEIRDSAWHVQMRRNGFWYQIPGYGYQSNTVYKVYSQDAVGMVNITRASGPGEAYDAIRVYQILPTRTVVGDRGERHAPPR